MDSPLFEEIKRQNIEKVRQILKKGTIPSQSDVFSAARLPNPKMLLELLAHGGPATINALEASIFSHNWRNTRMIHDWLPEGTKIPYSVSVKLDEHKRRWENAGPLQQKELLSACSDGDEEKVARLLTTKEVEVNGKGRAKVCPIHCAIKYPETKDILCMLINAGAALNPPDGNGNTPLQLAIINEKTGLLETLLQAGANPNGLADRHPDHQTPLHTAARSKDQEACKLLILAGADPTRKDVFDKTPELLGCKGVIAAATKTKKRKVAAKILQATEEIWI